MSDSAPHGEHQPEFTTQPEEANFTCHYSLRDPMQAFEVAGEIAARYGDYADIRRGLNELILNAIEHGNLEIGFNLKSELLKSGKYMSALEERLTQKEYADRKVDIYVKETVGKVSFTIVDEGKGFDPKPFLTFDEERDDLPHGRGIAIACLNCFEDVSFNGLGNVVTCTARAI